MRSYFMLLVDAARGWIAHNPTQLGAALAYYAVFSIGPLLLIVVALAGLVLGREEAQEALGQQLSSAVGSEAAGAVQRMLTAAGNVGSGITALAIGFGTLLLSALGAVVQLRASLNSIFGVQADQGSGVWSFLRRYVVAAVGVLGAGFLFLASIAASALLTAFTEQLATVMPPVLLSTLNFAVSLIIIAALFAGMFKWLPDVALTWRDVAAGALVTALLFQAGKWAIGWYIGRQSFGGVYGASATLVVLLVWVYYTSLIVFFGAELTRAWSRRHGSLRARRMQVAQA